MAVIRRPILLDFSCCDITGFMRENGILKLFWYIFDGFTVWVVTLGKQEGGLHGNNRKGGPAGNNGDQLLDDKERKEFQWLYCQVTIFNSHGTGKPGSTKLSFTPHNQAWMQ